MANAQLTIKLTIILTAFFLFLSNYKTEKPTVFKEKLSEYALFEGKIAEQKPAKGVMPYSLNAPLFSDYALKLRFIKMPEGNSVAYNADSVLQFPKGTVIAKTFYYQNDLRNAQKGRRLIETRILIHDEKGWTALPYIWNDEQTEAYLEVAGGTTQVAWKDEKGSKNQLEYFIPNKNQCKGCHERNGEMTPIGPSVRQLNGDFKYTEGTENQLIHWKKAQLITGLPENLTNFPTLADYTNVKTPIAARAKAYLDANCAHCHSRQGPAVTSGLFLDWQTTDSTAYGFYKTPVAAGRGSGNLKFDIVPGKPTESILLYRMQSLDPGIMMPELGRKMTHTEGVQLIKDWIAGMK